MALATYVSPTWSCSQSQYVKFRVVIDLISQNTSTRESYIRRRLEAWRTNTGYETYGTGSATIGITISGATNNYTQNIISSQKITYNSYTILADDYEYLSHDANGELSVSVSGSFSITSPMSGSGSGFLITFPAIWSSVSTPGTINYNFYWNESSVTYTWGAASAGTNNAVVGYRVNIGKSSDTSVWTDILTIEVGASTLSYTYTFSADEPRGTYYRCNVLTLGQQDTSLYRLGPHSRRNYQPTAPSISTINGVAATNNLKIPVGSIPVVTTGGTDSGGYNNSWTALRHALNFNNTTIGSWSTAYQTSQTFSINFASYIGSYITMNTVAYDGFVQSSQSTSYGVYVGINYTATVPTFNTAKLFGDTTLTIPISKIDGSNINSSITETINYQYSLDNSSWTNFGSAINRTATSSSSVTNLMFKLYSVYPSVFNQANGATTTFYIRTSCSIPGYGTVYSPSTSIDYTAPTVTTSITHADGITTFKFPLNNTIPITENNVTISWGVAGWQSTANNGSITIQGRKSINDPWSTLFNTTFTTSTNSTYLHSLTSSALPLARGEQMDLHCIVTQNIPGAPTPITIHDDNIYWNTSDQNSVDRNRIEYRPLPTVGLSPYGTPQSEFLRNGVLPNSVTLPYQITWDYAKAFLITEATYTISSGNNQILSDTTPETLFGGSPILVEEAGVVLNNTINPNETYNIANATILNNTVAGAGYIATNSSGFNIRLTLTVYEIYRNLPTDSSPTNSLKSANNTNVTLLFSVSSKCLPLFGNTPSSIIYTRTLT